MKDTKETQNFFPTQGKTTDHKGDTYSQQEGMQGQRSREREEARDKRAKQQKKQTVAKSKIPVNKTCKHKKISTRGCTEPTRDQYRQNTEDTLQDPLTGFFTKEKNPEKARGLQVPTTEKYIFNFLTL